MCTFCGLQVLLWLWLTVEPGFVPDMAQAQRAYDLEDYEKAKKHLTVLAKHGSAGAEGMLGEMYLEGKGVERDVARGLKHLERSAEAGIVRSQYLLSRLYSYGEVVPRDLVRAHYWLSLAALQERQSAPGLLRMLEKMMSAAEIEESWALTERRVPGARLRVTDSSR
ncbi:MAG: tetratricopeptide repeat protein [Bryobacteraceae bacterium]|nr:tetratricopeptide repeat protein [Bryobacteraceae bacterium]